MASFRFHVAEDALALSYSFEILDIRKFETSYRERLKGGMGLRISSADAPTGIQRSGPMGKR